VIFGFHKFDSSLSIERDIMRIDNRDSRMDETFTDGKSLANYLDSDSAPISRAVQKPKEY
jgi:hypothetical protein